MREYKSTKIRKAFEDFSNNHVGITLRSCEINKGVEQLIGSLSGWSAADFAEYETSKKRSHLNKLLFYKQRHGVYTCLGSPVEIAD